MYSWKGKRVLVTGGAGFIGSHLVIKLVEMGARVRVVDNLSRGRLGFLSPVANEIEFVKADLTSAAVCEKALRDIEIAFHLASKVGGIGYYMKRPAEVFENNVVMDSQVFIAAKNSGCDRFVFSSSAHVYPKHLQGSYESAALKESDAYPANPAISYGWAKLMTEQMIGYQQQEGCKLKTAVVRIVGAFGENQDFGLETGSVIPVFSRRAIEFPQRSPFTMFGEGRETRSYCYVGDIVDGMIQCVYRLSEVNEIQPLNLGNEGRIRILDVAKLVIEVSGKKIEIQHLPAMESGIKGQAVDLGKTKVELPNWKPKVTLAEGIARTYRDIERRLKNERL